jgi:hypothetical protein
MKLSAYKNLVVKAVALYVNSFCSTVASKAPSSLDYPLV